MKSRGEMIVSDYLSGPETLKRRELVWGVVREPPGPFYSHQRLVTDLTVILQQHVRDHGLGQVCVSPIDVVLDERKALVLQPDIIFVSNDRLGIIRNQIWGAPDLVVEVLSPGTGGYDSREKRSWYRQYGVREYWLVDPLAQEVIIHDFGGRRSRAGIFAGTKTVRSSVLPELRLLATDVFGR